MGNKNNIHKERTLTEDEIKTNQKNHYNDLHNVKLFCSEKRQAAIEYFNSLDTEYAIERSHLSIFLSVCCILFVSPSIFVL